MKSIRRRALVCRSVRISPLAPYEHPLRLNVYSFADAVSSRFSASPCHIGESVAVCESLAPDRIRRWRMTNHRHSAGFTLLELLLALGLTTLLTAAVYGAMSTYWNLAMDSEEEIKRAQIARALMKKLATDIQSCTFVEQIVQTGEGSETEEPEISEVTTSVYKNGLIGTDRDLVLYISRPSRELDYVITPEALSAFSRSSDLMIVRWLLADVSSGGLATAVAAQNPDSQRAGVAGLARGSGGVNGFGAAIELADVNLQMQVTSLISSEVQSVLFEYFDGIDWVTEWDSTTLNRMPQAVRIELVLRNAPSAYDDPPKPQDLPDSSHQLVVPVPVATPFVQETAI